MQWMTRRSLGRSELGRLGPPVLQIASALLVWFVLLGIFAGDAVETRASLRGLVFGCVGGLCFEDEAGRVYRLPGKSLAEFKGQRVELTGLVRRERGELRLKPLACEAAAAGAASLQSHEANPADHVPAIVMDGRDFQG